MFATSCAFSSNSSYAAAQRRAGRGNEKGANLAAEAGNVERGIDDRELQVEALAETQEGMAENIDVRLEDVGKVNQHVCPDSNKKQ